MLEPNEETSLITARIRELNTITSYSGSNSMSSSNSTNHSLANNQLQEAQSVQHEGLTAASAPPITTTSRSQQYSSTSSNTMNNSSDNENNNNSRLMSLARLMRYLPPAISSQPSLVVAETPPLSGTVSREQSNNTTTETVIDIEHDDTTNTPETIVINISDEQQQLNGDDGATTPDENTANTTNAATTTEDGSNNDEHFDNDVTALTRRLRCLFAVLTCPIVPLAFSLTMLLFWVLYTALVTDKGLPCDEPLRAYALVSLGIFVYTPYHRTAKRFLFGYYRERDGPVRPMTVRIYDQIYHTLCLLWMYSGIKYVSDSQTCDDTSPNLFHATKVFVCVQFFFMSVLVCPLLCLPCIYLWLVRQATLLTGVNGATDLLGRRRKRNISASKILESMTNLDLEDIMSSEVKARSFFASIGVDFPESCCICMIEFPQDGCDIIEDFEEVAGLHGVDGEMITRSAAALSSLAASRISSNEQQQVTSSSTHGEETTSGLNTSGINSNDNTGNIDEINLRLVVKTNCGHFFHRHCLKTWLETTTSDASFLCPLCREDLVPPAPTPTPICTAADDDTNNNAPVDGRNNEERETAVTTYDGILDDTNDSHGNDQSNRIVNNAEQEELLGLGLV